MTASPTVRRWISVGVSAMTVPLSKLLPAGAAQALG
jgi:hypothetical protein